MNQQILSMIQANHLAPELRRDLSIQTDIEKHQIQYKYAEVFRKMYDIEKFYGDFELLSLILDFLDSMKVQHLIYEVMNISCGPTRLLNFLKSCFCQDVEVINNVIRCADIQHYAFITVELGQFFYDVSHFVMTNNIGVKLSELLQLAVNVVDQNFDVHVIFDLIQFVLHKSPKYPCVYDSLTRDYKQTIQSLTLQIRNNQQIYAAMYDISLIINNKIYYMSQSMIQNETYYDFALEMKLLDFTMRVALERRGAIDYFKYNAVPECPSADYDMSALIKEYLFRVSEVSKENENPFDGIVQAILCISRFIMFPDCWVLIEIAQVSHSDRIAKAIQDNIDYFSGQYQQQTVTQILDYSFDILLSKPQEYDYFPLVVEKCLECEKMPQIRFFGSVVIETKSYEVLDNFIKRTFWAPKDVKKSLIVVIATILSHIQDFDPQQEFAMFHSITKDIKTLFQQESFKKWVIEYNDKIAQYHIQWIIEQMRRMGLIGETDLVYSFETTEDLLEAIQSQQSQAALVTDLMNMISVDSNQFEAHQFHE